MRQIFLLLAAALSAIPAAAAVARIDHGNVIVNGKFVTHGGRDRAAVSSPEGGRLAFVRAAGGKPIADCSADASGAAPALELWAANANGSGARKLAAVHTAPKPEDMVCAFDSLQFSSDGQRLYFETPAWATSGAIHVYDFHAGRERFLMPGNGLKVLSRCHDPKYRDDLIVGQHRYFVFSGSYDWDFLFSPDGKEVGPLGDGDHASDMQDACG